jgi:hypothetical protein
MLASRLAYWTIVVVAAAIYLGVNLYFLRTILPQPAPRRTRNLRQTLVGHWLPQAAVLLSLLLLSQQIAASLLLVSMVLVLTLMANNRKFASLNEPLLPADVAMTLRQWHVWHVLGQYVRRDPSVLILLPAGFAAALFILICEPRLLGRYYFILALLAPLPWMLFWPRRGRMPILRIFESQGIPFHDTDISASVIDVGFFPTFLNCMADVPRSAVRSIDATVAQNVLNEKFGRNGDCSEPPSPMPNIVVVLAEAFADLRTHGICVEPNPLPNYDEAVRRSVYVGRTSVPVYGGWTIRSEYSLVTGITLASFSNKIANPNATLVRPASHSLPKHLRKLGYRTLMVHPHNRRFYGRGKACPALGFDEFLDEKRFAGAPREGRYISDAAVAERIAAELQNADRPTFLFCVTMENHGPWCQKTPLNIAPFTVQPELSPANQPAFAEYLHHLRNADLMIRRLTEMVATADRPTIVLFVGDHLPALTEMYREVGCAMFGAKGNPWPVTAPWLQTQYFLLSNMPGEHRELDCDISFLSGLVLDCAGLNGDRFFRYNSAMRRCQGGNIFDNSTPAIRDAYLRLCYEVAAFPERYVSDPRQ